MLELADVTAARPRVAETARQTPLEHSTTFSKRTGADVRLKLENFQRTGSFKIRGATNKVALLEAADREAGVVAASAGNHAQGVALAASKAGVDAVIVMPEHAPISKINATRSYGAEVRLHGIDYDAAAERAHEIEREEGRTFVHAFDDPAVMAGQGTIGLEIVEQCPDVETVVVPIGGGGLIAGVATAVKEQTDARVVGVQAEGAASAADSLEKGEVVERDAVDTIADGIATRKVGDRTFDVIAERVDEVVTVSDDEIAHALTALLERSKTLVEGAGAVPLAAILERRFDYADDETIVPALCGGNIDLNVLTTVITRGLVERGRFLRIKTVLKDRPGALQELVGLLVDHRTNIYAIEHDRASKDIAMNAAEVELDLETRGHDHVVELLDALEDAGYAVEVLV
ncbi:threonine ammonia-lyase [Natronomonas pharaonis DSM 2160]|uniref:threonine ammonia-lyase n=1 Tax=Natronomonas pharaonis (strain ATCC 35678 / DSM 2160 / CIP 103997 / JCM 8858 / NBRC 14720 / NCIMB 2260 / Gabara) TaxID=348780 RepID=A0A1U7EUI0_NATPD|nr:threonine ammonia-lyase [Natronomonas pharaonis]CAI48629.1 threonine ammonia-lyase [Natronomonas pharaonis DSM 2160]